MPAGGSQTTAPLPVWPQPGVAAPASGVAIQPSTNCCRHRGSVPSLSEMVISRLDDHDAERAVATLVSAFSDDPVERWMYPDLQLYRQHFPKFIAALGGKAFEAGTAWGLDDCSAVALWLPPSTEPDDDDISSVLAETVPPGKVLDMSSLVNSIDEVHPTYPHWYLPWLGVAPSFQERGLGSTLMEYCLAVVDASHHPAYLESPNPRNLTFYERHGFVVTGEARAGSCPPLTFMLRAAR